MIEAGVVEW